MAIKRLTVVNGNGRTVRHILTTDEIFTFCAQRIENWKNWSKAEFAEVRESDCKRCAKNYNKYAEKTK